HFPAGTVVPLGAYDRDRDAWQASESGQVVQIVAVSNGVAEVDADGDGKVDDAASLANLGIGDDELKALAQQYTAGQSAWRVRLSHFSSWDLNWPFGPPNDATGPFANASGSTSLDCRTQVA